MMLSGAARLAGVMGWPVAHSRSPRLHGFWLEHYGIDGAYLPLPVRPEKLEAALRALPVLGFAGCNLTIPHKEAALKLIDRIDPLAKRIGAVNTVVVSSEGELSGSNTDVFGFRENLLAGAPGWRADRGPAVVIGAGGASRAALAVLTDGGAKEIRLLNRTRDRAEALAALFGPTVKVIDWDERAAALEGTTLLVNSTSLGMTGQPPLDLALDALPRDAVVTDMVYVPLETQLLRDARHRGNVAVDGLGMLLHQGRPGFAAWFGVDPEVTAAQREAVLATMRTA